jgi:hypothetical protein
MGTLKAGRILKDIIDTVKKADLSYRSTGKHS